MAAPTSYIDVNSKCIYLCKQLAHSKHSINVSYFYCVFLKLDFTCTNMHNNETNIIFPPKKAIRSLVRMTIIKKSRNNKCWRGCGEKGTLLHCWWECKLIQPLWRTVWRFLKKLKIELPYDPAIPLLGIYPEKTIIQKDTCTPMFIAALFTIARTWKQPKCPSSDE